MRLEKDGVQSTTIALRYIKPEAMFACVFLIYQAGCAKNTKILLALIQALYLNPYQSSACCLLWVIA
jgi:hypothetical protein